MSVMLPRDSSVRAEGAPDRPEHPVMDKWVLCWEFVERIVSNAQAAAERDNPGSPVPEVDWEQIWRAGDGAPSDEWAIGRIIRAASTAANGIALRAPEPLSPSAAADGIAGGVGPEAAALTRQPPAGDDSVVPPVEPVAPPPEPVTPPAEPVTGVVESVVPPAEPVTPPAEPVTSLVEPVAPPSEPSQAWWSRLPPAEPLTAPVVQATSVVEPVTLDRPDPEVTAVIDPANTQELLIAPPVLVEPHVDEAHDEETATGRITSSHYGWATVFTWIRNLGVVILLFVVWQLWGTGISQAHAQSQLKGAFEASLRAHHPPKATGAGPVLIPASAVVPSPAEGSVVAELQIPAIGVDQYVVSGTERDRFVQGSGPLHRIGDARTGRQRRHRGPSHDPRSPVQPSRLTRAARAGPTWRPDHPDHPVGRTPDLRGVRNTHGGLSQRRQGAELLRGQPDHAHHLHPQFSAAQRLIVVGELQQRVATPKSPGPAHLVPHRRFVHRQLGLAAPTGRWRRSLSAVAPRPLLPAHRCVVRVHRQVVHPGAAVGGRALSGLRLPHDVPSLDHLGSARRPTPESQPTGGDASAPRSEPSARTGVVAARSQRIEKSSPTPERRCRPLRIGRSSWRSCRGHAVAGFRNRSGRSRPRFRPHR